MAAPAARTHATAQAGMADENAQFHDTRCAAARKAALPSTAAVVDAAAPAPGAPDRSIAAPAGARSFSSRRALAEVGNLVELATAAAAAAAAGGKGGGKPLPTAIAAVKPHPVASAHADSGTSASAVVVPVLPAATAAIATAAAAAAATSAVTEQPAAAAGAERAKPSAGAGSMRAGTGGRSGGRKAGEREREQGKEDGGGWTMMTMTASLTACSEEACGGRGGGGGSGSGSGGVEQMDAEVPASMDIDWADRGNPLAATAYVQDIYALYRRMEKESMAPADYMSQQTDINEKMRAILLDWLIEVHLKFKLMPETLYLTTNLIDRFLAVTPVRRRNLQLVGVTAMLLASKYEEIWAPEVRDFVYISDNAYSKDEVLSMEKQMLNALRFHLSVPTPYVFASRFLKAAAASAAAAVTSAAADAPGAQEAPVVAAGTDVAAAVAAAGGGGTGIGAGVRDNMTQSLAWFLLELSLPDYTMLRFSPSHLAAAAVYTAMLARSQHSMAQGCAVGGTAAGSSTAPAAGTVAAGSASAAVAAGSGISSSAAPVTAVHPTIPAVASAAEPINASVNRSSSSSSSSSSCGKYGSTGSSSGCTGSSGSSSCANSRNLSFWCPIMIRHTGYTEAELQPCVKMMALLQQKASTGNLTAVHKKYCSSKFGDVAKLPPVSLPAVLPESVMPATAPGY